MLGIIGKKIGMTSICTEEGNVIPVTVIHAGPCTVTQIKRKDKDGYEAVQLAYGEKKKKHTTDAMRGHFEKAGTTPKCKLVEFREFAQDYEREIALGNEIKVHEIFNEGEWIDVVGMSKGKGFQGVVKRHGFAGVGGQTHGQHNRLRAPGSLGNSSFAARVIKGKKMAGRMGNDRVKILNLRIVKILSDQSLMLIKGAVPGAQNSSIILEK